MIRLTGERRAAHQLAFALLSGEDPPSGLGLFGAVRIPVRVETDGETIWYAFTKVKPWNGKGFIPPTEPEPGLLDSFLATRNADDVVAFVERYGGLDLCIDHQLPAWHNPNVAGVHRVDHSLPDDSPLRRLAHWCTPRFDGPKSDPDNLVWFAEPASGWARLVGELNALLTFATAVRDSPEGLPIGAVAAFAHVVMPHLPVRSALREVMPTSIFGDETADQMRLQLILGRWGVDRWAALGDIRPALVGGNPETFQLKVGGSGTGGAIALDALLRITHILTGKYTSLAIKKEICAGCRQEFIPESWARRGTRRYCPDPDCQKARHRDAQRDYERRRKAQRSRR